MLSDWSRDLIIRFIATALAASLALVSCDKSNIAENGVQQQTGSSRVIAVSFQNNSTKTELDGFQPKFKDDDEIKVSNGSATEDCTVSIDGSGNDRYYGSPVRPLSD